MRYNYYTWKDRKEDLFKNDTRNNRLAVVEWLQLFGQIYWNGEKWFIDGMEIRPIYNENPLDDVFEVEDADIWYY